MIWVMIIGGILTAFAYAWHYAVLGKAISEKEKTEGRDLTYEINPFTGPTNENKKSK